MFVKNIKQNRYGDRRGVALILVIGMLALMMITGMTFAIFMRTERAAAGNFRNDSQARHLLQVALARAIDNIEDSVGNNAYPPWEFIQSVGGGGSNTAPLKGLTNWIPWSVIEGTNLVPQWIDVSIPNCFEGRVSYVVLNCSGLLDANYAGGASERGPGTNVNEIMISSLGDVLSVPALTNGRVYAHLQELNLSGGLNGLSQHFVTYSAVPANGLVDISGDATTLYNKRAAITNGFQNLGLSAQEATTLFVNLMDYVDTNCIPGDLGGMGPPQLNGPYVEPVWMYNEAYASSQMSLAPNADGTTNIVSGAKVTFRSECFFPFRDSNKNGYKLEVSFMFTNCSAPCLMPAINPVKRGPVSIAAVASDYVEPTFFPPPVITLQGGPHPAGAGSPMHIEVEVSAIIRDAAGNAVDAVTNSPVKLVWDSTPDASGASASGYADMECDDPRLNHLAASWGASTAPAHHTVGAANTRALSPFGKQAWIDKGLDMYVANRPMASVGELGYLFTGSAWQTVRLYRHTSIPWERKYPVWGYFSVCTNQVFKGRVNVNTRNRDMLACVFANMPIDCPHGNSGTRLQSPELDAVLDAIMVKTAGGGVTNLSVLGMIGWTNVWTLGTELDCESLLRNSFDLLATRQQYFVVLLYAQTTKAILNLPDRSVIAGLRGVAEVWRDPQSPHGMFIRSMRIINN